MKTAQGSKLVYLLRVKEDQASEDGWVLAFTTQNSRSISSGVGTTQTKDGPVATPGTVEETLSTTSYFTPDDEKADKLEEAIKQGKTMEIWEADLSRPAENADGKYKGEYWEGRISSWGVSSPADGLIELTTEYVLEGGGKKGNVTVSDEMKAEAYEFIDTLATNQSNNGDGA